MGAKQITPMSEVDAYLEEQIQRIEQQTIYNLSYVGERCLNEARSTNSYKDQTGNLRSSIGYVIVKDGKIVQMSDFTTVKNGREGTQGGAANYTPFGYAFFTGDGKGAVRNDGKQIAFVYEDLAVVLTKKGSTWVAAEMPSMSDNATSTGNVWTTSLVAYKYDAQVIT